MGERICELQFVNGLQGDPAVYVLIKRLGEAFLFDLGSLESLSHRELLRIRNVFVSHAHMDHFIGFDRLLRVNVPHRRLIRIWGPAPFIERVQAKLRGYTWNLIDDDQIRFHVSEIFEDGSIQEALLSNTDHFQIKRERSKQTPEELCHFADGSRMQAVLLDHKGTPSVSYRLEAPVRFKVKVERLEELGLQPGSWLGQLQHKLRQGELDQQLEVHGKAWLVSELGKEVIAFEPGQSLGYLTDVSFDRKNIELLKDRFGSCSELISESSFLDADVQRAVDKAHLTSRQSALIASGLNAAQFHVFHISGIYGQGPEKVAEEAAAIFQMLKCGGPEKVKEEIEKELKRTQSCSVMSIESAR